MPTPTAKQQSVLEQMKPDMRNRHCEIKWIGTDLYVRSRNPHLAWVLHPDENKPWPTRWPDENERASA